MSPVPGFSACPNRPSVGAAAPDRVHISVLFVKLTFIARCRAIDAILALFALYAPSAIGHRPRVSLRSLSATALVREPRLRFAPGFHDQPCWTAALCILQLQRSHPDGPSPCFLYHGQGDGLDEIKMEETRSKGEGVLGDCPGPGNLRGSEKVA